VTSRYEWKPMPHEVAVACPQCDKEAVFESAVWVGIGRKKDVPFFKRSRLFEYVNIPDPYRCSHYAVYYPRLYGRGVAPIRKLPDRYTPQDWKPPKYWSEYKGHRLGTISCAACGLLRKHNLDWPKEAFYQVTIRGRTLWAYNRNYAVELQEFIQSTDRQQERFKSMLALDVVPTHFLTAKVRDEVVKKLGALLEPA
jgi:hypothetical protein